MSDPISLVFFGSFQNYSVTVLDKLTHYFQIIAVITTPPAPKGRHLILTPTEVQSYSESNNIAVFPLENLSEIPFQITQSPPDFIVVAGYGKLIPPLWLDLPKVMSVNLHPSLLPAYRGRFPAEWAILNAETETGVTLIKMSPQFDTGSILVQKKIAISDTDTRNTLYAKLFSLGADLVVDSLPRIAAGEIIPRSQSGLPSTARQLTREDGFIPWSEFESYLRSADRRGNYPDSQQGWSSRTANRKYDSIYRKWRALHPWPGIWSIDPQNHRIKLVSVYPLLIQYEGKKPTAFIS